MTESLSTTRRLDLPAAARWFWAVLFAAIISGAAWLAVLEEGHGGQILGHRWTSHDFPDGLGHALGATQDVPRRGMWGTLVIAIIVVLLFIVVERILPLRSWRKGLSFAPIILLLWGLVFCPLVNAKQVQVEDRFTYLPSGLFASNSSGGTLLSAIAASLVAGLSIARIVQLMRTEEWWRPSSHPREFIVDPGGGSLLEFPEEGTDQSREGAG